MIQQIISESTRYAIANFIVCGIGIAIYDANQQYATLTQYQIIAGNAGAFLAAYWLGKTWYKTFGVFISGACFAIFVGPIINAYLWQQHATFTTFIAGAVGSGIVEALVRISDENAERILKRLIAKRLNNNFNHGENKHDV